MPVGPFPTFQDCITAMMKKGKSKDSAGAICGAMESQSKASVNVGQATVIESASDGRFFVKAFLLDASLNINKWRVTKNSIDRNINSFIGKPLVLTEQFDHPAPHPGGQETLNHWLSYQETFRVGSIIDITTKANPLTGNPAYYAVIEITNDEVKQSLRDNKVPLYVSPAIAELVAIGAPSPRGMPLQSAQVLADGSELVENWIGVHLAIVSEPAFGVKKAVINETCGGDAKACLLQLRKASVEKYGAEKCGFCVKNALNKYANLQQLAQYRRHSAASDSGLSTDTSHAVNPASNARVNNKKMSSLEPTDPSTTTNNAEQAVEKVEQRSIPLQQQQQPTTTTLQVNNRQPIQTPSSTSSGPYSVPDLLQKISQLEQSNQLKELKIEELSSVNNTFGERVAALEMERRREKIERIITSEVIRDQKARLDKINYFTASTIPIEEIDALYKDVKVAIKKASVNQPRGRVPYLSASLGNSSVASLGHSRPEAITVDDETGLTPLQKQLAVLRGGP